MFRLSHADGKGIAGLFPALSGSPVVQQNDPTSLLHVVLRGARSVGTAGSDRPGHAGVRLGAE